MPDLSPERDQQFARMREVAREIFASALKNASIESAFARNVHCERRVLRIGDDLHDLDTYNRVFIVSIGKAAHTMPPLSRPNSAAASKASSQRRSNPPAWRQPAKSAGSAIFAADTPPPPPNPSAPPAPSSTR